MLFITDADYAVVITAMLVVVVFEVEQELEDDDSTVTQIYIRGWKVDVPMMEVFQECWPAMPRLQAVHLWNTGLTADTLALLASFLPLCRRLCTLVLDANTLTGASVSALVREDSLLENLSLRFCGITDAEASALGRALSTNNLAHDLPLLTLNLSNNHIGDLGASHIAEGLRMNRSLLTLNLASNRIGDEGVAKLSAALSQFPLSHKQVVERRQLLSKKAEKENVLPIYQSLPKYSVSLISERSSTTSYTQDKEKKDTSKRVKTKVKLGSKTIRRRSTKLDTAQQTRQKIRKISNETRPRSRSRPSGKSKMLEGGALRYLEEYETSPLTDICHFRGGELWVTGNRTLVSLNLSRNRIGERGFRALLGAVECQQLPIHDCRQTTSGLKRLLVHCNDVPDSHASVVKINRYMQLKDPFFRSSNLDLSKLYITPCGIPVSF